MPMNSTPPAGMPDRLRAGSPVNAATADTETRTAANPAVSTAANPAASTAANPGASTAANPEANTEASFTANPAANSSPPRSTLVVYFSRHGHTRRVAQVIAEQCGADTEEIVDGIDRHGVWGYLRSLAEAVLRRPVAIQPSRRSPRDYDIVIIGTPIWAWHLASPVRAYLGRHRGRFRRVAFFCCHRGWGSGPVLHEAALLCARPPTAMISLSHREVAQGGHRSALSRFVRAVRSTRRPRRAEGWRQAA